MQISLESGICDPPVIFAPMIGKLMTENVLEIPCLVEPDSKFTFMYCQFDI